MSTLTGTTVFARQDELNEQIDLINTDLQSKISALPSDILNTPVLSVTGFEWLTVKVLLLALAAGVVTGDVQSAIAAILPATLTGVTNDQIKKAVDQVSTNVAAIVNQVKYTGGKPQQLAWTDYTK